jgi:flagellar basal-body rod protein FlgB
MDIAGIGVFALAERRLSWLDQRQDLLAQNIANIDTPGWQPRDLAPFAVSLAQARALGLARTHPAHLAGSAAADGAVVAAQNTGGRAPDGNAVSLEDQLMKVADSETAQGLTTNLYSKYLGFFRLALGRGQ